MCMGVMEERCDIGLQGVCMCVMEEICDIFNYDILWTG